MSDRLATAAATAWAAVALSGVLVFSTPAWPDSSPPRIDDASIPVACTKVLLCNGQTADGLCTVNGGPADGEIVSMPVAGYWMHTFYAERSTATAFACNLETASRGPTEAGGSGWQFNATSLTETQLATWFTGGFDRVFVRCAGITGGEVTVVGLHCPASGGR